MRICLPLWFIFLLLLPSVVFSQEGNTDKIIGDFKGLTPVQFFDKLEKQVPYKFYYDTAQLDSFNVQITAKGETLTDFLTEAFKGTDIHFSIERNKNIFITKKLQIVTDLPKDFFGDTGSLADNTKLLPDSVADYGVESKKVTKISAGKLIEVGKKANQSRGLVIITGYIRDSK